MFQKTPYFYVIFVIGWTFGASNSALLFTSFAGLVRSRYRRRLAAAASVISWVVLVAGTLCLLCYLKEIAVTYYSSNPFERFTFFHARFGGYYSFFFWLDIIGNRLAPQLFWFRRCRTNLWWAFGIALVITVSLNAESVLVYFTTQSQDFLPSSWKR